MNEENITLENDNAEAAAVDTETVNEARKSKKKIFIIASAFISLVVLVLVGVTIFSVINNNKKIETINALVAESLENGIPSQGSYDEIADIYNTLPKTGRAKLECSTYIDKYSDVDLITVGRLVTRTADLKSDTPFSEVLSLDTAIKKLSDKEKSLVDVAKVTKAVAMTNEEKAALTATKYITSCMKNSDTFTPTKISVKKDESEYLVYIVYTGVNDYGGDINTVACLSVNESFDDITFPFTSFLGAEKFLNNAATLLKYTTCAGKPVSGSCDKVMYYLKNSA